MILPWEELGLCLLKATPRQRKAGGVREWLPSVNPPPGPEEAVTMANPTAEKKRQYQPGHSECGASSREVRRCSWQGGQWAESTSSKSEEDGPEE